MQTAVCSMTASTSTHALALRQSTTVEPSILTVMMQRFCAVVHNLRSLQHGFERLPNLFDSMMLTYETILQAASQHFLHRLQSFAATPPMTRLAVLLLACTFTDRDVVKLKVSHSQKLFLCNAFVSCLFNECDTSKRLNWRDTSVQYICALVHGVCNCAETVWVKR